MKRTRLSLWWKTRSKVPSCVGPDVFRAYTDSDVSLLSTHFCAHNHCSGTCGSRNGGGAGETIAHLILAQLNYKAALESDFVNLFIAEGRNEPRGRGEQRAASTTHRIAVAPSRVLQRALLHVVANQRALRVELVVGREPMVRMRLVGHRAVLLMRCPLREEGATGPGRH